MDTLPVTQLSYIVNIFQRDKLKIPLLAPQANKIKKELSHKGNDANGAEDLGKFEPQHLGVKLLQAQLIQQFARNHWLWRGIRGPVKKFSRRSVPSTSVSRYIVV